MYMCVNLLGNFFNNEYICRKKKDKKKEIIYLISILAWHKNQQKTFFKVISLYIYIYTHLFVIPLLVR